MVVVGWREKYHKTWCCEWQVWPVHSLTIAIGVTYKAIRWTVSLVSEEVILKTWRGTNFENTAKEYKRWSEISPGRATAGEPQRESHRERAIAREQQRWLTFGDRLGSDGLFDFLWKWNCICRKKKKEPLDYYGVWLKFCQRDCSCFVVECVVVLQLC